MTRRSEWPKGTEVQRTALGLPKKVWQAARVQALKEGRTFQELVAEALEDYLRKARKGGDRR
jgi:hypothetical protein